MKSLSNAAIENITDEDLRSAVFNARVEAGGPEPPNDAGAGSGSFQSINHNETLVDCRPASHRSLTGPVAYLMELYQAAKDADLLGTRKDLEGLVLSAANTERRVLEVDLVNELLEQLCDGCLLYTSPSPRDRTRSRMPSSA